MNKYEFTPQNYTKHFNVIVGELLKLKIFSEKKIDPILKRTPKEKGIIFRRDELISGLDYILNESKNDTFIEKFPDIYKTLNGDILEDLNDKIEIIKQALKMKPTRTISGVTTVTVLTKPFACPGNCIFCPNDIRMPKSYITTEPGAQRALQNRFSPYLQVYNRLKALKSIGHPTDKIELLILGGTWSYYPIKYQLWFIRECFRAMNNFGNGIYSPAIDDQTIDIEDELKNDINQTVRQIEGNKPYNQLIQSNFFKDNFLNKVTKEDINVTWGDLELEQDINSRESCRCVGLVLETRPDSINSKEVYRLRHLGATKIQLGIQTLDDRISDINKRGEKKEDVIEAFRLLRLGGFKIHGHIMPNLYGATPNGDFNVYRELFESEDFKPDELKIYPTSIIKNTEIHDLWKEGKYTPYTTQELVNLIADCMEITPEYCRLTRIIRDIPSTEIEGGNKTTNLREVVELKLSKENRKNNNIRSREIKNEKVKLSDLSLDIIQYKTSNTQEFFLQYITKQRKIAGFLRLSIPKNDKNEVTEELDNCAMIREVHVYGPSLKLNNDSEGEAQHLGLGTKLIEKAKEITKENGFQKLAVISSIGTREYYRKRGFILNKLYQIADLE